MCCDGSSCPVSHLKRSGFSSSSTALKFRSAGSSMAGRCFCAHSPTCREYVHVHYQDTIKSAQAWAFEACDRLTCALQMNSRLTIVMS